MVTRRLRQAPSSIEPVRVTVAAEAVLEQLRRAIGLGRFLPGDKLPPERSLARQLAVSRTTLRAALRDLVGDGVVEILRGAQGGIVVREGGQGGRNPRHTQEEIENTFAFRLANERAAARLAAARRTAADLRRLRGLLNVMKGLTDTAEQRRNPDNVARFVAVDADFHLAIARAARHPLFEEAVERALARRYLPFGTVFVAVHDDANHGHAEILAAIEAGDENRAERLMAAHVERNYRIARALLRQ